MYIEDKLEEIRMKKVILSLIVGGLSISGSCFAADNSFDNGSKQDGSVAFREVKSDSTWGKVKVNAKKVLENKKFQVAAIGTAVVAGTAGAAVAAYYYSPSFAGLVKSNAKVIANYGSKASKVVANYRSNASERIKAFLKIKPDSTVASTTTSTVASTATSTIVSTPVLTEKVIADHQPNVSEVIENFMSKWKKIADGDKSYLRSKTVSTLISTSTAAPIVNPMENPWEIFDRYTVDTDSAPGWTKWTAAGAIGAPKGLLYNCCATDALTASLLEAL